MIEIIPNWHPVFVHFSVALLSMAVLLFLFGAVVKDSPYQQTALKVAEWNLWLGAVITMATVAAGWYAYNTVAHDAPSHAAMTVHRNWALSTVVVLAVASAWLWKARKANSIRPSIAFLLLMLVLLGMLGTTAWHGGEIVYRYGLGVMSLPKASGDGHAHEHADGASHGHEPAKATVSTKPAAGKDDHSNHNHKH